MSKVCFIRHADTGSAWRQYPAFVNTKIGWVLTDAAHHQDDVLLEQHHQDDAFIRPAIRHSGTRKAWRQDPSEHHQDDTK